MILRRPYLITRRGLIGTALAAPAIIRARSVSAALCTNAFNNSGLKFAIDLRDYTAPYEHVVGQSGTVINGPLTSSTVSGVTGSRFTRSSTQGVSFAHDASYAITGAMTIIVYMVVHSASPSFDYVLSKYSASTSNANAPFGLIGASNETWLLQRLGSSDYYQGQINLEYYLSSLVTPFCVMASTSSGVCNVTPNYGISRYSNPNDVGAYQNTHTSAVNVTDNGGPLMVGCYQAVGPSYSNGVDATIFAAFGWDYQFTATEFRDFYADPFQMFVCGGGARSRAVIFQ